MLQLILKNVKVLFFHRFSKSSVKFLAKHEYLTLFAKAFLKKM